MPPNIDDLENQYDQDDQPCSLPTKAVCELASPSPHEEWSDPALPYPPPPRTASADMLRALSSLPEVRQIPWKLGQELPASKALEHERAQVRAAVMLSQRGNVAKEPCNRCARGTGRFSQCIHLDDWFQGACATCQMSSKGNLCSHRTEKEEAAATARNRATHVPIKISLTEKDHAQQELPHKRKRVSIDKEASHKQHRKSYNIEELESRFGAPLSRSSKSLPYEKSFNDDPAALLRYVYRQQQSQINGTKRHHQQQYNEDSDEIPVQDSRSNGHNSGKARVSHTKGTEGSFSLGVGNTVKGQQRSTVSGHSLVERLGNQDRREDYRAPLEPSVALIDSLPRKTQKQLYSIIGGLESGIRSQIQQTDNLQKQLDLLRATLGIDVDDSDSL
ncbi:hypothetical protein QTJ16_006936 [Diplocarpon rosae]|uniref:Uncharacterized protein n=1 Tax=Diplocarpon rosae TaxID=946125 RepID=A0AAD9SU44_9HELO|nr:hypothetical protein QTJ16_006936 [Diplocarpon rosae]PBP23393.1 hypothetical protein BUE80_DR005995 [Diplocarpon rosae]